MKRFLSKNFVSKDEAVKALDFIRSKSKLSPFLSFGRFRKKMGFTEIKLTFIVDSSSELEQFVDEFGLVESKYVTFNKE
jgi:hypothetical protein